MPAAEDKTTCAIGLDVGGTKIAAGLVTHSGCILARRRLPTHAGRGGERVLDDVLRTARDLVAEAASLGREVLGVGVGVAELVNPDGNVTSSHTIDWRDIPARERVSAVAPTVIDSDVRTAARAEAVYGAGRAFDPFLYLTIGTGLSFCLVQGGHPYTGARGNAILLSVAAKDGPDGTDARGRPVRLLEDLVAGPALVRRYNRRSRDIERAEDVVAAAEAGDPQAAMIVESAGAAAGAGTAWLINALDPAAVVVGGGLGLAGGRYWSSMLSAARDHIWAENTRNLPILPAALNVDAGVIGAAAAFLKE
jgi:glucokinase